MMIVQRLVSLLIILFVCLFFIGYSHQNGTIESIVLMETIAKESKATSTELQNNGSSSMESSYPVIGQFKTRDKLILISTGPDCPLYTLKSSNGQILAIDLPADKLTAKFPELKDLIEQGIANWAGLDDRYQKESDKSSYGIRINH